MKQSCVNPVIIQRIAKKYNLSQRQVKNIVDSQGKFIKMIIENNEFHNIRLPYFGIFKSNIHKVAKVDKWKGS